jgi:pyridoxamine 5'-phosphate oxidase
MNLSDIRREYARRGLHESEAAADPIAQLQRWLAEAREAHPDEFTSMTLATADRGGRPSARVVLLKGADARGLVFYTSYVSRKARELEENPRAALVLYWPDFERQVRVEGAVEHTSREESAAYFASRPRGSQIGAWASRQSAVIGGRGELEQTAAALEERFAGGDVPLPDFWGGYRLLPEVFEFWQGRPDRLHDRLAYTRRADGSWTRERLSP